MEYRRDWTPGAQYFFTVVTADRRPVFADEGMVALLREATRQVRRSLPFTIDAAVVLPDHLHVIWTLPAGDTDYASRWSQVKGRFSRLCGLDDARKVRAARRERGVWQTRYWEHRIRDEDDHYNHLNYIHFNPVRHGYCAAPWEWPWSSFPLWVRRGMYPERWVFATPPTIPHSRFD